MVKILTVIVPCYNEEESIKFFYDEIARVSEITILKELQFNILFINDGSRDNTLNIIKEMSLKHDCIKYISFSRNFGKESAIYAGLEKSKGDYVALIDADLQDPPSMLEQMYLAIKNEGYDCVATKRISRKGEPLIRSFFARNFYKLFNLISKIEVVDGARDFRLMTRQMADAMISLRESNRFTKGLFSWVGFKVKWLAYENIERVAGKTKWSFWNLFLYSVDGILAFSVVPLALSSFLGILLSFFSFVGIITVVLRTVILGDPVSGWPSLVIIICFIGGLQLLCLGIIGQYVAKTYLETKNRPIYIIKESNFA
ncbi:MAG: glycosyltransferase family 2 protein [Candidatus Margulisiibacteriota bacterium]|jgi:glycosyltransferase involved in cell wall biosynthesis